MRTQFLIIMSTSALCIAIAAGRVNSEGAPVQGQASAARPAAEANVATIATQAPQPTPATVAPVNGMNAPPNDQQGTPAPAVQPQAAYECQCEYCRARRAGLYNGDAWYSNGSTSGRNQLPFGRRYYGGRYYGSFRDRYYGPQYGNF